MSNKVISAVIFHLINIFCFIVSTASVDSDSHDGSASFRILGLVFINFLSFGFYMIFKGILSKYSPWLFLISIYIVQNLFFYVITGFAPTISLLECLLDRIFESEFKISLAINVSIFIGFISTYFYDKTIDDGDS